MYRKLKQTGFTLTELMAVVIIIAILAGIGFGSYKKAVERSRFSEGQTAGATVAEAVTRYYYDNMDTSYADSRPKAAYLDVGFDANRACVSTTADKDYCFKTRYFEIIVQTDKIKVTRIQGNAAKDYYFYFYPEHLSKQKEECGSLTEAGGDLCKSMGYTSCSGMGKTLICHKP